MLEPLAAWWQRRRLLRESRTVSMMIAIYCRRHHGRGALCPTCQNLKEYALARLTHCPFGKGKTVCSLCPVHCYRQDRRTEIKGVMRFAGSRMIWRSPWLTLAHLSDRRRKEPLQHAKLEMEG